MESTIFMMPLCRCVSRSRDGGPRSEAMDDREMPVTRTYDLSLVAKGLLICATLVLATETPLRYAIALSDPARAADVDLQWLIGCPRATIVIGTIAVAIASALKIAVVFDMWKIIRHFFRGEFFSRPVSALMRRVSSMLLGISITVTFALIAGLGSLWLLHHAMPGLGIIGVMLHAPSGTFVGAIIGFGVAAAIRQATDMAEEALYTV